MNTNIDLTDLLNSLMKRSKYRQSHTLNVNRTKKVKSIYQNHLGLQVLYEKL